MLEKIKETFHFIKEKTHFEPEVGIILGSGLGGLVNKITVEHSLSYSEIKNFPVSTVKGHGSKLILGTLNGKKIIAMQGRFHFYEGYTMQELTFPVRVMKYLGIKKLILSNAAGGVNPSFKVGDLMIIKDHINLMGINPLIGKNEEELGARFPDMSEPYDRKMIAQATKIALQNNYRCHTGVYAAVSGPCFETPAEYNYIKIIGADAVGMSTVPEAIVARHMNIPCFAVSVITDIGGSEHLEPISHEDVLKAATAAEEKLTRLITELIAI